jgi:hypothetical protein
MARFEFESATVLFCFSFIFVLFGESCLLVSWYAGGRCDIFQLNEGGRAVTSVVVRILFYCYEKIDFCVSLMPLVLPLVFSVDLALFCVFFIESKSKCLPFSLSFNSALVLWSALVLKRVSLSSDSLS